MLWLDNAKRMWGQGDIERKRERAERGETRVESQSANAVQVVDCVGYRSREKGIGAERVEEREDRKQNMKEDGLKKTEKH